MIKVEPFAPRRDIQGEELVSRALDEARGLGRSPAGGSSAEAGEPTVAIPGYEIEREIGRGAQGVVYRATEAKTGRRVAIKVMRSVALGDARRFEHEIRVLARLKHPDIAAVRERGETDGTPYFVMDYAPGTRLDDYAANIKRSSRKLAATFAALCRAVDAAHSRGVIHRDLKPGNVLVDGSGTPRVLDFGLAKSTGEEAPSGAPSTAAGMFIGSLPWTSPEQAAGDVDSVDVRSDVYSLGVMLYVALTGEFPCRAAGDPKAVAAAIASQPPTPPRKLRRDLGGDLETIVLKALAKERERRYQTAGDLGRDLERWLAGEAIEAKRDSFGYVAWKALVNRRRPAVIGAALLLAGLAAGAAFGGMYFRASARAELAEEQKKSAEEEKLAARTENESLRKELEGLKARLRAPQHWRATFTSGDALAKFEPKQALALIEETWPTLATTAAKQQFLKAVSISKTPWTLRAYHLGMSDSSPHVRTWAIHYLKEIALFDPAIDPERYRTWYEANKEKTLEDAAADSQAAFFAEFRKSLDGRDLKGLEVAAAALQSKSLREIHGVSPRAVREAKEKRFAEMLLAAIKTPGLAEQSIRGLAQTLEGMEISEPTLRDEIRLLARDPRSGLQSVAPALIGKSKEPWAFDQLAEMLKESVKGDGNDGPGMIALARALADRDDDRAIPVMIAAIEADRSGRAVYDIGYFGLSPLTGVEFDQSHDGAWWRRWHEKQKAARRPTAAPPPPPKDEATNQAFIEAGNAQCAAETQDEPEKKPAKQTGPKAPPLPNVEDVKEVPAIPVFVGGDPKKHYALIGDLKKPEGKRPLLLVLPGGDGSIEFFPFMKRIYKNALPGDGEFLMAQIVAPVWDPAQPKRIVWPTAKSPWKGMKFNTEKLVTDVIEDVERQATLDPTRIYTLSWSSGGPAAYAISQAEGTRVTGSFVAMSVFRPEAMAPERINGKSFYLLQSPDDKVTALRFAEAAKAHLAKHGARVELTTYAGGHGWREDPFGHIRRGVEWLDKQNEGK
ncbi:MAG TPA: protein kinase [Planctomycetia bacterium]|nr:protein kinase [Planctomycetia bacterium]